MAHAGFMTWKENREAGFTLAESLISVALLGTLVAAGIPGYLDWVKNTRRDAVVTKLEATLHFAQSEALKRQSPVSVCPSPDGEDCSGTGSWDLGWMVFNDVNSDGEVGSSETMLHAHLQPNTGITIRGSRNRITYQAKGFPYGFNDSLKICDDRGTPAARKLVVSNLGRIRVSKGADTCQ